MKRYTTFLVRYWYLENSERRIEVEQIRSGATARLASIGEAVAWIRDRAESPAGEVSRPTPPGGGDGTEAAQREEAG